MAEAYTRFKQHNPCPVCGGYGGAYKKEKRCKGFMTDKQVWCQRTESPEKRVFFDGLVLFGFPLSAFGDRTLGDLSGSSELRSGSLHKNHSEREPSKSPSPVIRNAPSEGNIPEKPESKPNLNITLTDGWFIVSRDGVEITRVKEAQRHLIRGWEEQACRQNS